MNAATILDELAASTPHLPGARCAGRHALYDLTTEADRTGPAGAHVLKSARAEALRLCAGCPELAPCGAWLDSLPPKHRPRGVVAGRIITGRRQASRRTTHPERKPA